ncbi:presqualene diphosphate synthase HpnD [Chitinimonas sp. BJB300]|uniref:presqualene diphosphate synthase HpnD n=1 Tax=Chitinimonas sp. BJB300 TaxID=1559339 RepID=UPI000C0E236B|nr:presqualene diphosphate synthase HpnD [Chitinimonas sp. BJB300]PHV13022.1 squalene synthase HpnD [Chitinimonas sp. BJB300]TSJ88920.1 presqualene diphosphate synthase HpnD [Chitinimonas sp. BJB300]
MTPDQYCEDKAAQSGSSFYYSFRFLPLETRRAITALYAFCREVDDVVDETHDENVARTTLNWWRSEVGNLYAGTPQHPVTRALQPHVARLQLPREQLLQIIDGMEMDLTQARYNSFKDLQEYCYLVASVVGLLSARIFGVSDDKTYVYAEKLGLAFQLTNIIRDVGEDARRGRIYLPVDELQRFNVPAADIQHYRESDNFKSLMAFQIERAEGYYQEALAILPRPDRKHQRAGLVMAAIYRATLEEIKADGPGKVLNQRLSLTPIRKLWLAWKTWWFA